MSCPFRSLSENFEKTIVDVEAALVLVLVVVLVLGGWDARKQLGVVISNDAPQKFSGYFQLSI
jgi:hypothetical protein